MRIWKRSLASLVIWEMQIKSIVNRYTSTPRSTIIPRGTVIKSEGNRMSLFPDHGGEAESRGWGRTENERSAWNKSFITAPLSRRGARRNVSVVKYGQGLWNITSWARPSHSNPRSIVASDTCQEWTISSSQACVEEGLREPFPSLPRCSLLKAGRSCCFRLRAHWWLVQAPVDGTG